MGYSKDCTQSLTHIWDGEDGHIRSIIVPYNPVRVEHYWNGAKVEEAEIEQATGSQLETFQRTYGINMAYVAMLWIENYGIHEARIYYTDDFYVSEYFGIGEPLEYIKQPQGGYMDYAMYYSSDPVYYKKASFGFDLEIGDQVELQKQNIHNYGIFETVSEYRISEKASSYEDEIWEEGRYRLVVNRCLYQPGENVYIPYESEPFEVLIDKTFIRQPSDAVAPPNGSARVEWKAAFYPKKLVIQKLAGGEYQDIETYANGSAIYLTLDDDEIDFRTMSYSFDEGTYRLRLWYGNNDNEFIESNTFEVEKFRFTSQPTKRNLTGNEWTIGYHDWLNLEWKTNYPGMIDKAVLCRRPSDSDEDTPWDKFDISNKYEICQNGEYTLYGTNKWEDYDYFLRLYMTEAEDSYIDSDIFKVHMQGTDRLNFFTEGYQSIVNSDGEIAVPVMITDNPGFASGVMNIDWDEDILELSRIESTDFFPIADAEPIESNEGHYEFTFGDEEAVKDNQETGVAFTAYFKPIELDEEFYDSCNFDYDEKYDWYAYRSSSTISISSTNVIKAASENVDSWGCETGYIWAPSYKLALAFDHVYTYADKGELRIPVYADRNPGFKTCKLNFRIPVDSWSMLEFKGIEANSDFAPLISYKADPEYNEYGSYETELQVVFGDEEATENFENTGYMFTIVLGITEESELRNKDVYQGSENYIVNVEGDEIASVWYNGSYHYIRDFMFNEQPKSYKTDYFDEVFDGKCSITWRTSLTPKKQVLYRRPSGSDDSTPWEAAEIREYYCCENNYVFDIEGVNGDTTYDYFIRAYDPTPRYEESDFTAIFLGEEDYIDSEIFTVNICGSGDTPGLYCIDDFKANGTYPEQEGMIFAGWYEDPEHTKPYMGDTGYAYAKFIDKDCLSIKWQVPVDFADKDTTDIRLISSLDCGKYDSIHLVLKFAESGSEIIDGTITRLYDTLNGYVNQENVAYVPEDVFCKDSHYFAAFIVTGMPKALYTTELVTYAYIVTEDGTTVYGDELNFRVSDDVNYHE